ncbi:MAG: DUF1320 domain-containing protein [Acetobacter malorum]
MAYATVDDMTNSFGEDELITVTTPRGVERTVIDPDQVNTAIGVASDEIDSYLRRRYAVPLVSVSPKMLQVCCVLARWVLWSKTDTAPSDSMRADRKDAIAWLGNINSGSVTLDGATPLNVGEDFSRIATRRPSVGFGL